ncbi:MAG: GHKL domain-containing protein [Butyrivibrio sp.]|nr:GHKL domain-containing protein [Butyrivibrio sp.]
MMAILRFCGSLFVNFIFYDFFRGQLKPRVKDRKLKFLILLLCAAAVRAVNSFNNGFANLVFGVLILTAQVLLIFKDDCRREVFLLLIGEAVALFMELVVYLFLSKLPLWALFRETFHYTQETEDFIMGILSYILCWLVLHNMKIYFLGTRYTMRERFPLSFFALPFSTALIYLGIFFGKTGGKWAEYSLNLGYILLPAANILMFFTINKLFFVCEKNRERQLIEQQTALQQRYYEHLEEIDMGHRRYVHDLKNFMVSIGALAAAGKNGEIVTLLGDMETELDSLTGRRYTSDNILNAILWEKAVLAERYGVSMDITAEENPEWECIQGKDLIVMAGNLLDNAIEAANKCRNGSVSVAFHTEEHFLVMEVENTCVGAPSADGKVFLSTKPDVRNHGFGILNVRDTAEKYGGLLYAEQKENRFTAILTIARNCLIGTLKNK